MNNRPFTAKRRLVSFGWALQKMLRSKANFEVLEGFLTELLGEEVTILDVLEGDSNKKQAYDKFMRIDLKVRLSAGDIAIIEVQVDWHFDYLLQCSPYRTSPNAITEYLYGGESYSNIDKVISVNILYFDLGTGDDYIYHGTTTFKGIHCGDNLQLNEEQRKYIERKRVSEVFPEYYLLEVKNFDGEVKDSLDEWIYFLNKSEIPDRFTARGLLKARRLLDVLNLSDSDYYVHGRHQDDWHQTSSMIESRYLEGMFDGEDRGREEVREEIALKLLVMYDDATIAELTGLLVDKVIELRKLR